MSLACARKTADILRPGTSFCNEFPRMTACKLLVALLALAVDRSSGHGYLHTPAGRGTVGYPTPINPDHMGSNCGGFVVHQAAGGKCGVCGDPWNGPRKHETGGQFFTGKITGKYQAGETVSVKVHIVANHLGWFEFRLCPVTNPKVEVTQQCLNQHLLKFADGKTRRILGKSESWVDMKLKLPANLTCTRCVLQWKYHCGNNIYICADGKASSDCGFQEEYYGCADITISAPKADILQKTPLATKPTTPAKASGKCVPVGIWVKQPDMFTWCAQNCPLGHCPADKCAC